MKTLSNLSIYDHVGIHKTVFIVMATGILTRTVSLILCVGLRRCDCFPEVKEPLCCCISLLGCQHVFCGLYICAEKYRENLSSHICTHPPKHPHTHLLPNTHSPNPHPHPHPQTHTLSSPTHLRNRDEKVEAKAEDCPCKQDNKDSKSRILKVSQLQLQSKQYTHTKHHSKW